MDALRYQGFFRCHHQLCLRQVTAAGLKFLILLNVSTKIKDGIEKYCVFQKKEMQISLLNIDRNLNMF